MARRVWANHVISVKNIKNRALKWDFIIVYILKRGAQCDKIPILS